MPSVVVDTNIWVSTIINPGGRYDTFVQEIASQGTLFTAEEILAEARDVVFRARIREKYHLTEAGIDLALGKIRGFATVIIDLPDLNVVQADPDDNIIVACALKAGAEYIISYDPHLTDLKEYSGIRILTPKQFQPLLKKNS